MMLSYEKTDAAICCLLGTAVGDAIGLPYEGLSKDRLQKIYHHPNKNHFFFGKGMISDDLPTRVRKRGTSKRSPRALRFSKPAVPGQYHVLAGVLSIVLFLVVQLLFLVFLAQ